MNPLISFIVPVYNAEKSLQRCVDSLLVQGLDNNSFEIVLVNDGSTDRSEMLCLALSDKYSYIKTVSQNNAGLSQARNRGVQNSQGDYLCFVDSDDCLVPGGIASLINYCDGNNDLIRFWCEFVYSISNATVDAGDGSIAFSGSGLDYLRQFGLETFCWNYLYRRTFLEENRLYYTPGIIGEDFLYMFDVMMANPRIVSVARRLYQYNINPDSLSTTRSPIHSRRWVKDLLGSMTKIASVLESFRESDSALYQSCRRGLDNKMMSLFSRCLSAEYSINEFRTILSSCKQAGLLPLQSKPNTLVSILSRFPFLYPISSAVFRRVFLPYIYPKIDRYGE